MISLPVNQEGAYLLPFFKMIKFKFFFNRQRTVIITTIYQSNETNHKKTCWRKTPFL